MKSEIAARVITAVVVLMIIAAGCLLLWVNPALAGCLGFLGASRLLAAQEVARLAASHQPWAYHPLTFPLLRLGWAVLGCVLCLLGAVHALAR